MAIEIPDDLRVDIRKGKLRLHANNRTVELEISTRGGGIFHDGSVLWRDLWQRYVVPALYQLSRPYKDTE